MQMFNTIGSRNELADFLDIPRSKLTHVLYVVKVDNYYATFEIPKKSGGFRTIKAPAGDLKEIQRRLAEALANHQHQYQEVQGIQSRISHAFEKEKNIITNAQIHRNKRFVVNFDLEDFFDSFHFGRVCGYFEKNRNFQLPKEVATVIAQLTCYQGALPQGAPSSPVITNLICEILDIRLLGLAKKYRLDYTRYADDLTFSTNDKVILSKWDDFYNEFLDVLSRSGFRINEKKTRVQYSNSRQTVTGLVVNKKLSVDHRYYKQVRAMAHALYSKGSYHINSQEGNLRQLEGRFAFVDQLDKYNNTLRVDEKHNFRFLNGREKQYQQFLFYRYFFASEKPVIVTEGKTDVAYLKAALKNLHNDYPELITKHKDGHFEFKVTFLRKSKRLAYFLGLERDGADAMKVLYNYFSEKDKANCPNYLEKLTKLTGRAPKFPVVVVFDNEIQNSKKPLAGFMNHIGATDTQKSDLQRDLRLKILPGGNLFLLTNPLVNGAKESEIEQLFDEKTLAHEMGGKTFCPKDKFDNTKHYGKEIFSKYIQANYRSIDFSGFKPMLDNMTRIVSEYEKD